MADRIDIVIVDRQNLVREGLICLMSAYHELHFVQAFSNGPELLDWMVQPNTTAPDILLLDSDIPGRNGRVFFAMFRKKFSTQKVVILSNDFNKEEACYFITKGANSYLCKNVKAQTLAETIRRVHFLGASIDPLLAKMLHQNSNTGNHELYTPKRPDLGLTAHRIRVLRHMLRGLKTKEIAKELFVSYKAAEHLRAEIWHVTGCEANNYPQLFDYAFRHGLVSF